MPGASVIVERPSARVKGLPTPAVEQGLWDTPVDVIHTYNSPTDTHLRTEPPSRFPLKAISGSDVLSAFIVLLPQGCRPDP